MIDADESDQLAQNHFSELVGHLRILAADADTQNAWLHPCGWTRAEQFEHERAACMPIDELYQSFADMWSVWRSSLAPMLTPAIERALDDLMARFEQLEEAAWVDELETLARPEWDDIRQLAISALAATSNQPPE